MQGKFLPDVIFKVREDGDWSDEVKRNYQRNYKLINLKNIPKDIQSNIVDEISKSSCGDRSKLLNYFTVNKLKTLTENIGDF